MFFPVVYLLPYIYIYLHFMQIYFWWVLRPSSEYRSSLSNIVFVEIRQSRLGSIVRIRLFYIIFVSDIVSYFMFIRFYLFWVTVSLTSLTLKFRSCRVRTRTHWANFGLFCENICQQFPYKCARWFLYLPNFVKAYQTLKTLSSCLGAGQIFVRREIWRIC